MICLNKFVRLVVGIIYNKIYFKSFIGNLRRNGLVAVINEQKDVSLSGNQFVFVWFCKI